MESLKFGIIGGGSWATAIAKMLCENLPEIGWYMRNTEAILHIQTIGHNPNYLSAVTFCQDQLVLSSDINIIIDYADVLIFAIPSAFVGTELKKLKTSLEGKIIFSAIKGIVPESGKLVGAHFNDCYHIPMENIGVIAGPCHAEEVALERLSYLTIACAQKETAIMVANAVSTPYIRCTTNDDIIGIEYGLGYGDNFQSVLMSNAIREIKRYVKKAHRLKRDINGSAYLGDLLVTGYSVFSRNRMFGNMIGKGYTVKSAQLEMSMIAEGYYATKSAYDLNTKREKKAKIPIIKAMHSILYEGKSPKKVFKKLITQLD